MESSIQAEDGGLSQVRSLAASIKLPVPATIMLHQPQTPGAPPGTHPRQQRSFQPLASI